MDNLQISYTSALLKICEIHQSHYKNADYSIEDIPKDFGEALVREVNSESQTTYRFRAYIAIRGEAVLLKAFCERRKKEVAIKVKLPQEAEHVSIDGGQARKFGYIRKWVSAALAHKSSDCEDELGHKASATAIRFSRGALIQKQLAQKLAETPIPGLIPSVYEIASGAKSYYSMEYFQADSFLAWCKNHSEIDRLVLFRNLLRLFRDGVHKFGVAHCDIKPENILIQNNFPVLLDFGIAKILNQEQQKLTLAGSQLGSPAYAPPELLGDAVSRDFRVDIFELGILLHILWTCKEPDFDALGIVDVKDLNLHEIYHDVEMPLILRHIFQKATADSKAARYADVQYLAKDFDEAFQSFVPKMKPLPKKKVIPIGWESQINPKHIKPVFYMLKTLDYTFEDEGEI